MSKRACFLSFHHKGDSWRAAAVRSIGAINCNEPARDNDWNAIVSGAEPDRKIKRWVEEQMRSRACAVVLIGANTANRKWINHEITLAWESGLGVVGLKIHGLKNSDGETSPEGKNPFDCFDGDTAGRRIQSMVKCYNPPGMAAKERHIWIASHLANIVEEAISIRKSVS